VKDGWDRHGWNLVADHRGRPLGHFKSPSALIREQLDVIREFLIRLQKGQREPMSEKKEKTNIVWLAGTLKFDPKVYDNNVKALLDVGLKSAVQISVYTGGDNNGSKELAAKLRRFKEGDFLKVVAMLRPYGVKGDDGWKNSMSIDITEIKTEPPKRENARSSSDDDIPF